MMRDENITRRESKMDILPEKSLRELVQLRVAPDFWVKILDGAGHRLRPKIQWGRIIARTTRDPLLPINDLAAIRPLPLSSAVPEACMRSIPAQDPFFL